MATLLMLASCTTRGSMSVEVRDRRTGQPVADALVRVDGHGFFVPFWPHWRLSKGIHVRRETDAQGMVAFDVVSFPAAVYIITDSHLPLRVEQHQPPKPGQPADWLFDREDAQLDAPALEVRIGP